MTKPVPSIEDLFRPLFGLPAWQVKQGFGSFLTFEFGNPHLEIREPRNVLNASPRVREKFSRRRVTIRGDWHLWIYICSWTISLNGQELAHHESTDDQIAEACFELDGQALTEVTVPEPGKTRFVFDLGGVLETRPYDDDLMEQWLLYLPDGDVFTYRSDGAVRFSSGSSSEKHWVLWQ